MDNQYIYTCPCCGYKVYSKPPEDDQICGICYWQNDIVDLVYALKPNGPNHVSLLEAQKNFQKIGACEKRFIQYVKLPSKEEIKDPEWRPIDLAKDKFSLLGELTLEEEKTLYSSGDLNKIYYWKRSS